MQGSWPGLSRPPRSTWHGRATIIGVAGPSPAMTLWGLTANQPALMLQHHRTAGGLRPGGGGFCVRALAAWGTASISRTTSARMRGFSAMLKCEML